MAGFDFTLVLSGIYSVTVAGVGFWAGCYITGNKLQDLTKKLAKQKELYRKRLADNSRCRHVGETLLQQSRDLKVLATCEVPAISLTLTQAIERLALTTQELSEKFALLNDEAEPTASTRRSTASTHALKNESSHATRPRDSRCQPKSQRAAGGTSASQARSEPRRELPMIELLLQNPNRDADTSTQLSADEVTELASGNQHLPAESSDTTRNRFPFACQQFIALWCEGEPVPASEDFRPVQCHDISAGGISFFCPELPAHNTLAITVGGMAAPMLMAVEVVHTRAVYMYGQVGNLISCKFVRRIGRLSPMIIEPETQLQS